MMDAALSYRPLSPHSRPFAAPSLLVLVAALASGLALAQQGAVRPETPMLSEREYRVQLEEVIVRAQRPRWRGQEEAPRWDREKFELPVDVAPPRLQWAPGYARDEREDYEGVRDRMNAEPRIKLFEFKF